MTHLTIWTACPSCGEDDLDFDFDDEDLAGGVELIDSCPWCCEGISVSVGAVYVQKHNRTP